MKGSYQKSKLSPKILHSWSRLQISKRTLETLARKMIYSTKLQWTINGQGHYRLTDYDLAFSEFTYLQKYKMIFKRYFSIEDTCVCAVEVKCFKELLPA